MIKKTISYTDFDQKDRKEDFYFNLSKSELTKLHLTSPNGDFGAHVQALIDSTSRKEVVDMFEKIITMSYGERSEDGRYFNKSEEITQRFKSSAAYDELFMELLTDTKIAAEFIRGLVPADLQGEFDSGMGNAETSSQTARERSEAQMQGFQKKQEAPKTTVEKVPELPAAAPVLDESPALTAEEIQEVIRNRQKNSEINSGYQSQNVQ